ncbi:hypothetical protein EJ06DRAFT_197713 [Trichodelitschia bisporula]|uniref:Uncharacterized protein n=1 Tax=Trichodelitschia bisporula TaxID=703511 RepID=A0A6G1I7R0_9PEZI|nr:hypothetical protein EJ06DRAFT_197713 [Trichodelitschia bisporula]
MLGWIASGPSYSTTVCGVAFISSFATLDCLGSGRDGDKDVGSCCGSPIDGNITTRTYSSEKAGLQGAAALRGVNANAGTPGSPAILSFFLSSSKAIRCLPLPIRLFRSSGLHFQCQADAWTLIQHTNTTGPQISKFR